MKEELEKAIKTAAKLAAETTNADNALKFTQAALNAAHAFAMITNIR